MSGKGGPVGLKVDHKIGPLRGTTTEVPSEVSRRLVIARYLPLFDHPAGDNRDKQLIALQLGDKALRAIIAKGEVSDESVNEMLCVFVTEHGVTHEEIVKALLARLAELGHEAEVITSHATILDSVVTIVKERKLMMI